MNSTLLLLSVFLDIRFLEMYNWQSDDLDVDLRGGSNSADFDLGLRTLVDLDLDILLCAVL